MKLTSIDLGEILAFIVMGFLFYSGKISSDIFILFLALKFTIKLTFK